MSAAGFTILVMGIGSVGLAAFLRTLRSLTPDPRASEERQAEARRASAEIQSILVPWMRKLGLIAALIGALLMIVDAIW